MLSANELNISQLTFKTPCLNCAMFNPMVVKTTPAVTGLSTKQCFHDDILARDGD